MQQRADQYPLGVLDPAVRSQAGGLLGGFTGSTTPKAPIKAYHGSPHDFDAFDLSKIGTGEGAQAYGRGLYFAENPEVAAEYKNRLAPGTVFVDGPTYSINTAGHNSDVRAAGEYIKQTNGDIPAALEIAKQKAKETPRMQEYMKGIIDNLQKWHDDGATAKPQSTGKQYEVNINADPEHFLDWDKPLNEQSDHVRSVYQKITGAGDPKDAAARVQSLQEKMDALAADRDPVTNIMRGEREWMRLAKDRDAAWKEWDATSSGGKMVDSMARLTGDNLDNLGLDHSAASAKLRDAGIPGIKYLDQGSRGSGTGTHNYVVFNDRLIDIVRKYGIAGLIAGGVHHFSTTPVDHDPYAQ
jgi:hypothetical protein